MSSDPSNTLQASITKKMYAKSKTDESKFKPISNHVAFINKLDGKKSNTKERADFEDRTISGIESDSCKLLSKTNNSRSSSLYRKSKKNLRNDAKFHINIQNSFDEYDVKNMLVDEQPLNTLKSENFSFKKSSINKYKKNGNRSMSKNFTSNPSTGCKKSLKSSKKQSRSRKRSKKSELEESKERKPSKIKKVKINEKLKQTEYHKLPELFRVKLSDQKLEATNELTKILNEPLPVEDPDASFDNDTKIYLKELENRDRSLKDLQHKLMHVNSPESKSSNKFDKLYKTSRVSVTQDHMNKEEYFRLNHDISTTRSPEKVIQNEKLSRDLALPSISMTLTDFNYGLALSLKEHNSLSLPVSTKLKNKCLTLDNYRVNEELTQSIAENIQQLGDKINSVIISS